jgi:hypothetical protein
MANYIYRIRGCNGGHTKREECITRIRYKTREEAEADKGNYSPKWKNIRVVKVEE